MSPGPSVLYGDLQRRRAPLGPVLCTALQKCCWPVGRLADLPHRCACICCQQTFPARSYGWAFLETASMEIIFCLLASVFRMPEFLLGPVCIAADKAGREAAGRGPVAPTSHWAQIVDMHLAMRKNLRDLGQFAVSSNTGSREASALPGFPNGPKGGDRRLDRQPAPVGEGPATT